jgi:flagellar biosynthesis anti-sigma factor FlgM
MMQEHTMSTINGLGGSLPISRAAPTRPVFRPADVQAPTTPRSSDSVELGDVQHLMTKLKTNDVRMDKVAEIKAQIQAGTYETDAKLDAAADKLLDDVL